MQDSSFWETVSRINPGAQLILKTLYQIGDASNVNVLKGLAELGSMILDGCAYASLCEEECRDLSMYTLELLKAIVNHACERRAFSPSQQRLLEMCEETFNNISSYVQSLRKRTLLHRIMSRREKDALRIRWLQCQVADALNHFQVEAHIDNREAIASQATQLKVHQEVIMTYIDNMSLELSSEITRRLEKETSKQTRSIGASFDKIDPTPFFFGRQEELEELCHATTSGQQGAKVAVLGPGGIGKTTLVKKLLHHELVANFFGEHRFFMSCESADSADAFLMLLAKLFRVEGKQLLEQIKRFFADLPAPVLLILDNFETPWDSPSRNEVEGHLSSLASLNNLSIVVAMRGVERPRNVLWNRPFFPSIRPMDKLSARRLFFSENECDQEDPVVDQLLECMGYVPLAVSLVGHLAQVEEPASLLHRYARESTSLLNISNISSNRESSVDVSILLSLQSHRMKRIPEALHLLSALSLLPDGLTSSEFETVFACLPRSLKALSTLRQTALAYNEGKGDDATIRVLNPVRDFMIRNHPPPPTILYSVETYYLELANLSKRIGSSDGKKAVKTLLPHIGNMHSLVASALKDFIETEGSWRDGQAIDRILEAVVCLTRLQRYTSLGNRKTVDLAIEATQKAGEEKLCADAKLARAQLHRHYAENREAITVANSALELYSRLGDLSRMAECHHVLGHVKAITKHEDAVENYERGLHFAILSQNRHCQAKCLASLAESKMYKGRLLEAEQLSKEALVIFKEMKDLTNTGLSTFWLGRIDEQRSHFTAASNHYKEAYQLLEQAGDDRDSTRPLICLGDLLFHVCDYPSAMVRYGKAIDILQRLREVDRVLGSYVMISQVNIHVALYEREQAVALLKRVLQNFVQLRIVHGQIHCHLAQGDIAVQTGSLSDAEACYLKSLALAEESSYGAEIALCNRQLGRLYIRKRETNKAFWRCAMAFETYSIHEDVLGKATCMQILGDAFIMSGDVTSAEACYGGALHFLRRLRALRGIADCLLGLGKVAKAKNLGREATWFIREALTLYSISGDTPGVTACGILHEEFASERSIGDGI